MAKHKFTNTISSIIIFAFLITESPIIYTRVSGIYESDLNNTIKNFYYVVIASIWLINFATIYFIAHSKITYKAVGFFLIIIPIFIVDPFFGAKNNTLLYGDYLTIRSAIENTTDAIQQYRSLFFTPFFRTILLLIAFIISPSSNNIKNNYIAIFLLITCIIIFASICYIKKGTGTDKIPGFIAPYAFELLRLLDRQDNQYNYQNIFFNPKHQATRENIALIIDESIRNDFINSPDFTDNIDIKSNINWEIHNYGRAVSGSNCSSASNLILRKGPRPDNLSQDIRLYPLIWAYAKKAGFKTILIDAQNAGRDHDYFDDTEHKLIDVNIDTSRYESDYDTANSFIEVIKKPGNFIIVIKKGAHFPYKNRYPDSFTPNFQSEYINSQEKRIEYARAVAYQTGGFFKKLLSTKVVPKTLIIYTSDHGQNLLDSPGLEQCTATGHPHIKEGMVPLLIMDNQFDITLNQSSKINQNKSSHFNIFATLLHFLGYASSNFKPYYATSLLEPINPLNRFSYGAIFGHFGSSAKFQEIPFISSPKPVE